MIKKFQIYFAIFVFGIMLPLLVSAQTAPPTSKLDQIKADAKKLNQLPNGMSDPSVVIGLGIKALMMFMGAIMFLLVVYGGVLWMTAAGNSERISKAKNIIIWSALGVAVMLSSYIIVNFVFSRVLSG